MSNEERGLYITMLCRQWTQGHVTSEEMARLSSAMAQPLASHVFAKFKEVEPGIFKNTRMEIERAKQAEFRANRSESGKVGASKRWHSHSSAIAQPMAKHSSPSPSPSNNNKEAKPSLEEVKLCCAKAGLPESDAVWFWNKCEGNGWTNGGKKIKSWPHVIGSWKAAGYMPSQKSGPVIQRSHGKPLTDAEKIALSL